MTIQLNADKNLNVHEAFGATRLEMQLSDENGGKDGQNRQTSAVAADANIREQSVSEAIDKLTNSLDTILARLSNY